MITGFEKIVEERIKKAIKNGQFENLTGTGEPLELGCDATVPEDLRIAYKVLKNADCLPPEIEIKKEIQKTEDLLSGMGETAEKYKAIKRLNFLIMKLNTMRHQSVALDMPQRYANRVVERLETASGNRTGRPESPQDTRQNVQNE